MTGRSISRQINSRRDKIKLLQQQIAQIQEKCPHENLYFQLRGSSGNWDREASYWIEWKCLDCEKKWETDQSREEFAKYPKAIEVDNYGYVKPAMKKIF